MTEPLPGVAQVYVELRAADPEALSAFSVARARLEAGRQLRGLRRLRLFELRGMLPAHAELEERLHHSICFYNPAKERATVRANTAEPAPFGADESLVLVLDRGLERRAAAERWWRQETGEKVEVREGTVWALTFEPGADVTPCSASLAVATDRAHGLFSNPHFQDWRPGAGDSPPFPWLARVSRTRKGGTP